MGPFVSLFLLTAFAGILDPTGAQYTPDWPSIDSRPLPGWFDQVKVGIFIHWGVYSVPAADNEWFWFWFRDNPEWGNQFPREYMTRFYKPDFTYQEFAPAFTAEFYNPDDWARLFQRAGARYVVLTSKHHDGYTLWPSAYSPGWNVGDVGPKRDLLGDLAASIRRITPDLRCGLYHSLFEWYHPVWRADENSGYQTTKYLDNKLLPELRHIVETYRPEILWSDGDWMAHSSYWRSPEFLAWLYNESPVRDTVVVNDRWGSDTKNTHGGFYSGEDHQNPGVLLPHKWEGAHTLDTQSWGWRSTATVDEYWSPEELIRTLVMVVSCGGNFLLNVGPRKDGMIPLLQQERLVQMGEWLGVNGDAIYGSVPHSVQNDTLTPGVWYTRNEERNEIYAIVLGWPGRTLRLGSISVFEFESIRMLGAPGVGVDYSAQVPGIQVQMPLLEDVDSKWAYTLVFNCNGRNN